MKNKYDAVSGRELAKILGVTERSVIAWAKKGCPTATGAEKKYAKKFCVRDVVEWRIARAKRGDDENGGAAHGDGDVASHGEVVREMTSVLRHAPSAVARVQAARFLAEHCAAKTETAARVLAFVEIANVDEAISAISAHGNCPHCGKEIS